MPKFGQVQFNEDYFGTGRVPKTFRKKSIHGIPLGCEVRRTVAKSVTFRVRRGNGQYGSVAGHKYQDKFSRVVPSSINNPEGEPFRVLLTAAVAYWKNILSTAEKKEYNHRAGHLQYLSGYNLFTREVILGTFIIP